MKKLMKRNQYNTRPTTMSAVLSGIAGRPAIHKQEPKAMLVRADGRREVFG